MQPTFINLPEMKVVGLGTPFISIMSPDKNSMKVIPALWRQFMQQLNRITNVTGNACLGLVEPLPPDAPHSHPDEMFYIASTEVSDFTKIPPGMIHRTVPAGRYAAFIHQGKLDSLQQTMTHIFTTWLPASGLQLRPAPHLERYDDRFNAASDQSEFDILLPIQ